MATDLMTLTNPALISINKKIIDYRNYSSNLVSTTGNVLITDNIASNFDNESYLSKSGLYLSGDKISIFFNSVFVPSETIQTAWKLTGASTLYLQVINNVVTLKLNSSELLSFSSIKFPETSNLQVITDITPNKCTITVINNGELTNGSIEISPELDFTNFTSIVIGNDNANLSNYWLGSIDVQTFSIKSNDTIIYSPSASTSLTFSKIVVSDGTLPMSTGSPVTSLNHMHPIDINEISRSGNTMLLTAEVTEEIKLTIKEIGLYAIVDGDEFLYSSVKGLNINKGKNLLYDLVLTINIATTFLNMIGFPTIVLNVPDRATLKNFKTVEDVCTYVFTSLERLIALNAREIGYNRAQIFYRLQQQIAQLENCYSAVQVFEKLVSHLSRTYEDQIRANVLYPEGDIQVPINGKTSGFSTEDYILGYPTFVANGNCNIQASFTTSDDVTTKQGIMYSGTVTTHQPLSIYVENGKCHLSLNTQEAIEALMIPGETKKYLRNDNQVEIKMNNPSVPYYGWVLPSFIDNDNTNVNLYNFHTSYPTGVQTSSVVEIPTTPSEILWNIDQSINTSSWEFFIDFSTKTMNSLQYIIGDSSSKSSPINLYIGTDNLLYLNLPELNISINTETPLQAFQSYSIGVSYDGSNYVLSCTPEDGDSEFANFESLSLITLDSNKVMTFGSSNSTDKFNGSIDFSTCSFQTANFSWYAAASLYAIFTTDIYPTTDSNLYDINGVLIPSVKPSDVSYSTIIDSDIFSVLPNNIYFINITYTYDNSNSYYNVEYSKNNNPYIEAIPQLTSPLVIGNINTLYFGVTPQYLQGASEPTILDPFSGTLNFLNFLLECPTETWTPSYKVLISKFQLLQYYYLQKYNKNEYTISDISNFDYKLNILDSTFTGNKDLINFNSPEGFTLCTKVHLKDSQPKVLLAKSDLTNTPYFYLTFINEKITFNLHTSSGDIQLVKVLETNEVYAYEDDPFLLTVKLINNNGNYVLNMYHNNTLVATTQGYSSDFGNPTDTFLTNYLPTPVLTSICAGEYTGTKTMAEFVESIQDNTNMYVSDILVIDGAITDDDLYYITNLTDTNF